MQTIHTERPDHVVLQRDSIEHFHRTRRDHTSRDRGIITRLDTHKKAQIGSPDSQLILLFIASFVMFATILSIQWIFFFFFAVHLCTHSNKSRQSTFHIISEFRERSSPAAKQRLIINNRWIDVLSCSEFTIHSFSAWFFVVECSIFNFPLLPLCSQPNRQLENECARCTSCTAQHKLYEWMETRRNNGNSSFNISAMNEYDQEFTLQLWLIVLDCVNVHARAPRCVCVCGLPLWLLSSNGKTLSISHSTIRHSCLTNWK